MFTIGLELSFERLKSLRRLVFGLGLAQMVAVDRADRRRGGAVRRRSRPSALILGAALSLSSTAIVVPVLAENKLQTAPIGRYSFAMLLFQDLAVAPLLFMVAMLARGENGDFALGLALTVAPAALAVGVVIVLGRLVLRPLFHSVALTGNAESFMAACLLVVLGAALIAAASGLSMALGAFLAGLLLAETEFRREIEVTIEPFKGLLLGLFFVSVGAELDLSLAVVATPARSSARSPPSWRSRRCAVSAGARVRRLSRRRRATSRSMLGAGRRIRLRADRRGRSRAASSIPRAAGSRSSRRRFRW